MTKTDKDKAMKQSNHYSTSNLDPYNSNYNPNIEKPQVQFKSFSMTSKDNDNKLMASQNENYSHQSQGPYSK